MVVPAASAIRRGVAVNIILKADQRSGRLTSGRVADVLTRGDHPRGVKVRTEDGLIGRVQSLRMQDTPTELAIGQDVATETRTVHPARPVRNFRLVEDYRNDPVPVEERSLEDYVTFKAAKVKKGRKRQDGAKEVAEQIQSKNEQSDTQDQLQKEFPGIDSALIAAILSESASVSDARTTLRSLA